MNVKLLIVQGRPEGKSLLFPEGEYVFGRGAECHIRPNSDWVSRQHCLLRVTAGGPFLRDLGSRNGTLVNGIRLLQEVALRQGDRVQIGPLLFEVLLEESPTLPPVSAPPAFDLRRDADLFDTKVRALETAELNALPAVDPHEPGPPPAPHSGPHAPRSSTLKTV